MGIPSTSQQMLQAVVQLGNHGAGPPQLRALGALLQLLKDSAVPVEVQGKSRAQVALLAMMS